MSRVAMAGAPEGRALVEATLRELFELVPSAVLCIDARGELRYVSDPASRVLGYDEHALEGQSLDKVLKEQGLADRARRCARGRRPQGSSGEVRFVGPATMLRKDGQEVPVELRFGALEAGGVELAVLHLRERPAADVTPPSSSSESLLHVALESLSDGVLLIGLDLVVKDHNERFAELWGFGERTLVGKRQSEVMAFVAAQVRDPEAFLAPVRALVHSPESESFDRIVLKDGRVFERFSLPERQDGVVCGRMISIRDVTDREQTRVALARSESLHRRTVESVRATLWRGDPETLETTFVSPEAEALLGYPIEQWLRERHFWPDHVHPEDLDRALAFRATVAALDQAQECEYRMLAAGGAHVWVHERSQLMYERGKAPEVVGVMIDVSERHRAQAALAESEERLRRIIARLPLGIQLHALRPDGVLQMVEANEAADRLLKIEHKMLLNRPLVELYPEFEASGFYDRMCDVCLGGEAFTTERVERDEQGIVSAFELKCFQTAPGEMAVVFSDISARKREEEAQERNRLVLEERVRERTASLDATLMALRVSERLYRLLAENATDMIARLAPDGVYVYVSPACRSLLGYEPEELVGRRFYELLADDDFSLVPEAPQGSDSGGLVELMTCRLRRKDGSWAWVETSSRWLEDPVTGEYVELVSVSRDISQRRAGEEREARRNRVLEALANEQLLETVLERIVFLVEGETAGSVCFVALVVEGRRHLVVTAGPSLPVNLWREIDNLPADFPGVTASSKVMSGERVLVADLEAERDRWRMAQSFLEHGFKSVWIEPIVSLSGEILGAVLVLLPVAREATQLDHELLAYASEFSRFAIEQNKARESLVKLSSAVEQSPVAVLISNHRAALEYVNPAFETASGFTRAEVLGTDASLRSTELNPPEVLAELWATVTAGSVWNGELASRRKDGALYWEHASVAPVRDRRGKLTHFVEVRRDITGRKAELAQLTKALEEADAASRAKTAFVANISHELRTPMNAIIGLTHLCLRTSLTAQQTDYLEKVIRSAKTLLEVLNDILDFSKIEADKLVLEVVPFKLVSVIAAVESMTDYLAREKGLKLEFELAREVPHWLLGDGLRLQQVLLNVVGNAVKFTAKGSVSLRVSMHESGDDWDELVVSVKDTGIGLSQLQLARLFHPFAQADVSTTRRYGGTGLGLAICKRLVESMGGRLWAESTPGAGSTFVFTARFGRCEHPPQADEARGEAGLEQAREHLRGARVLVVEDNAFNQQVARELAEEAGAVVEVADNGRQALAYLERETVDIVLMDLQMPELDGFETARLLRQRPSLARLPVLATTASALPEERQRCLDAGMNDVVLKPLDPATFLSALARWIAPGRATPLPSIPPASEPPEAPVVVAAPVAAAALYDLAELARYVRDEPATLRRFAHRFAASARATADELREALAARDAERVGALGHRLKAAARAVGAFGLVKSCEELEAQGRLALWEQLEPAVTDTCALIARVAESIALLPP